MDITKQEKGDLNILVKIHLDAEDYMPKVDESIKKYSKQLNLKGFRKGMVPAGVVKKMYGDEIMAEELNKIVGDELNKYMKENEIKYLGEPLPHENGKKIDLNIREPREQEFAFELGLQPEFNIDLLEKKATVTKYKVKVDEELVDDEVEHLRKRYGKMTNPDTVEEGDVLYVHLQELTGSGEVKEEGIENKPSIPLEKVKDNKVKKELMEMNKEDHLDINMLKTFDYSQEEIAKELLETEASKIEEMNDDYRVTLLNINRVTPADVDMELFKKIYGEEVTSEEQFREKIQEELDKILEINTERKLNHDISTKLIEETDIPLPEEFLRRWLLESNKDKEEITEETVEKEFEPFLSNLKWNLIVNKIGEESDIKVEREDVLHRTKELIQQEYGFSPEQEGMGDYLDQLAEQLMKNEEHMRKVYENVRDEKIFKYLKDQLTITEEEISYDKFKELSKK